MNLEEIIRRVLEEMKKLEVTGEKKKKMLVLGNVEEIEKEIRIKFEKTFELEFSLCFDDACVYDALLLAEISPNTLQKMAMGMNPRMGPVLEMLMRGKPVRFLEEGLTHRGFISTCPLKLYKLYEESVEKIMELGMCPESLKSKQMYAIKEEKSTKKRTVITERDIKKLVEQGENSLSLFGSPLITPLAKDLIRDYKITLIHDERRK